MEGDPVDSAASTVPRRDVRALCVLSTIRGVMRKILTSHFARWRTVSNFLGLIADAQPESLKMQLLEFKYRFKMANTRLKSLELEMIDIQKDFSQKEIAMTLENGNLVQELEAATARALGAESVISKLENEVMLIYGIQQKEQEAETVGVINRSRLSWASLSSGVSRLLGDNHGASRALAVSTGSQDLTASSGVEQSFETETIAAGSGPPTTPDASRKASQQAAAHVAILKVAALAMHIVIRYKTSVRSLQRGFMIWRTHTSVMRALAAAKQRHDEFKKQNEKYQNQVKEHWNKTEAYMKKLREKYDDSKKKREEINLEVQELGKEKSTLTSEVQLAQTRIAHLESALESQKNNSEEPSIANQAEIQLLQGELEILQSQLKAETALGQQSRHYARDVLDVLSEYQQWEIQQKGQLEQLASFFNVNISAEQTYSGGILGTPAAEEKGRQVSFTREIDKKATPQASRIMHSLRKSAASSKQLLKSAGRTPSRGRSLHSMLRDAEPQFSSSLMTKFEDAASTDDADDAEFELKAPQFIDLPVPPSELETVEFTPIIFNPDIEQAMTGKVPVGSSNKRSSEVALVFPAIPPRSDSGVSEKGSFRHHHTAEDTMSQFENSLEEIWRVISTQKVDSKAVASNVRVAIRMRPLNSKENGMSASKVVRMSSGKNVTVSQDGTGISENSFSYDFCFDASEDEGSDSAGSQKVVFEKLGMEVLAHAWHGYNACLFAYGQTGSGKSYSMMGTANDTGIIPRVCRALFYMIIRQTEEHSSVSAGAEKRGFSVEASYLEIYNENIRDLLDPARVNLKVREHPTTGVFVENLSSCAVECYKDVEDLLEMGLEQRTTAATNMNRESSRSHSVFTLSIRSYPLAGQGGDGDKKKNVRLSRLRLVDLAGSERASSTGATGARLREGANINKSLSTLGRCISALAKIAASGGSSKTAVVTSTNKLLQPPKPAAPVVPFRESILTWLLRESLCGNAKTSMLATISPAHVYLNETLSTLRYAYSAKQISTQAVVNDDPTAKIINDLRGEVVRLRVQLEQSVTSNTRVTENTRSNDKLRMSLSNAESALQAYEVTNDSENTRVSMRKVKRNLLNRRVSSFGTEDMNDVALLNVPYFVFLSNDPQLNLAVKVYLPVGKKLKIGKAVSIAEPNCAEDENMLDLQIDGLGIEDIHCVFDHDSVTRTVIMSTEAQAVTYHNGAALIQESDDNGNYDDGLILRNNAYIMEGENYGVTSDVIRRSSRSRSSGMDNDTINEGTSQSNVCVGETDGLKFIRKSVEIRPGDRIVLGECSHVFVYVTPDYSVKVAAGISSMPTYNQAIREVILGRVESVEEKKRRIVTRMCCVYRKPAFKRYFEESFVDALKSVREASKMAHRLCPERGLFFKVTISSLIDMSTLFSLSINDLCDYTNLTIRIRCYELIDYVPPPEEHDEPMSVHMSPSGTHSASKYRAHETTPPPIRLPDADAGAYSGNTPRNPLASPRPMSLSRRAVSYPGQGSTHNSPRSRPLGHGQSAAYVHPDSCRVVMEISLHSFYEGLVVLRALYSVLQPLSSCIIASRAAINGRDDEFFTEEDCDLEISRIIVDLVHCISTNGDDSSQTAVNSEAMDLNSCRGLFEIYKPGIFAIKSALNSVGIDGEAFLENCKLMCFDSSSRTNPTLSLSRSFITIIIDAVESSLFRGIQSCFESAENLVMKTADGQDSSHIHLVEHQYECSVILRTLLENQRNREASLGERLRQINEVSGLIYHEELTTTSYHQDTESAVGYSALETDAGVDEVNLPADYYESAGHEGYGAAVSGAAPQSNAYDEGQVGAIDDELLISEKDREGASDWTVHVDEDTGYKFIYSHTLGESRWLNY